MELQGLRALIEQASADGRLSQAEQDQIMAAIREDGQVTAEELALAESLLERINRGEIQVVD